ncbi:MAG TPA: triple tyrosine motif-containing protein, partial [Actinomycetota bacterium]
MAADADTSPPETTITEGPSGTITTGIASFTWTGADDVTPVGGLEYAYRLDPIEATFSAFGSATAWGYSGLGSGIYTFHVKARDAAGNEDPTPASQAFTVDASPPETTITEGPIGSIPTGSVSFTWTGTDDITPVGSLEYAYRLDPVEATFSAFGSATSRSYAGLAPGSYTFYVAARDAAGQEDPTLASRSFTVDSSPPETTITGGPAGIIAVGDVTFTWTGVDGVGGGALQYAYRLDPVEATFSAFGSATSRSYAGLTPGSYTFYVAARDAAGHEDPTPASRTFTVVSSEAARLLLAWTDNSDNELGFQVERRPAAGGPFEQVAVAPDTLYLDSGLAAGTSYCYRVRSFNEAGVSDYSEEACGTANADLIVAVVVGGGGTGSVSSNPLGLDCPVECIERYPESTVISLSAIAAGGSSFAGWSGDVCSGAGPCAFTLTADTTVTATFAPPPVTLSVAKGGTGQGVVTSTPAGIDCGSDCTETYASGTVVTLTATASAGSVFTSWSGGACGGTAPCVLTLTADTTATATFTPLVTLTVTKGGAGSGTVTTTPAGIDCGSDCEEAYARGTVVTLTATAVPGSVFTGWSGGGCSGTGTCVAFLFSNATVTATFAPVTPVATLTVAKAGAGSGTVTSAPAGLDCGLDCSEAYVSGTAVTLTATPGAGSVFTGWSGGGCSGTALCAVTLTADVTVTATFAPMVTLTVARAGAGIGTVTSAPAIDCGLDCTEVYPSGAAVVLTATAGAGSAFIGWSGGGCSGVGLCVVTLTADVTVTATFVPLVTLTVTKAGAGSGTVTSAPAGIDCGSDCTEVYLGGTSVTLTATAGGGSVFTGWSGGGCSGTGSCALTLTANTTVTATFVPLVTLTVTKAGAGSGTVTSAPAGIDCGS